MMVVRDKSLLFFYAIVVQHILSGYIPFSSIDLYRRSEVT